MTIIRCHSLSKTYKGNSFPSLENLTLEVAEHSVFGFLGPNGAGKTTTIKILTGLMSPSAGEAWIDGEKVLRNSLKLRSRIGYLGQEATLYKWMKGRELLLFVAALFGMKPKEKNARVDLLLEMSGLKDVAHNKISSYSGGMVQRLGIAQALVSKPKVLFLDEPTSSLDPIGRKEVLEFVSNLKHETTVFMSTHILSDVERVCNFVGILNKGKLLSCDKLENLKSKYATNLCEVACNDNNEAEKLALIIKEKTNLTHKRTDSNLNIFLTDIHNQYRDILKLIYDCDIKTKRIEIKNASLEDIFVELVKN